MRLGLLLLYLGLPAAVLGQFSSSANSGAATNTGYNGTAATVAIPASISNLSVTAIGRLAFYNSSISSVTLPASVTNIDDYAFDGCANLTNVTTANASIAIGTGAFMYCSSLSSFAIPYSASLGNWVFFYDGDLTNAPIPAGVTNIGEGVFGYCTALGAITVTPTTRPSAAWLELCLTRARPT